MADNKKNLDDLNKGSEKLNQSTNDRLKLIERENYLLKEQLKLNAESLDLSSSLVDSIKEVLGISSKRSTADSNLLKVNKEVNKQILNQKMGLKGISEINKIIAKNQQTISKGKLAEQSLENSLSKKQKERVERANKAFSLSTKASKLIEEELSKVEKGEAINQEKLDRLYKQESVAANVAKNMMDSLPSLGQQLVFTKLNNAELEKQNTKREEELAHLEGIERKLGAFGGILKGISKIPLVGDLVNTDEILKSARDTIDETGSGVMGLASGLKTAGKQMVSGILNPANLALAAITAFGAALVEADKESGEVAKNLGISYHDALELGGAMLHVSQTSKDILVTQNRLLKAQEDLNEYFGTGAKFSGEIAEEFASIQTRTGLSNKAMGFFTRTAMKSGKEVKGVLTDITKTVQEQNSLNKISLSLKQVQEEIAKTSNAFQLTVKGSVQELTKAVFASKKLGASMEQIEGIASNLLDFESSIEAELQAELLLGKNINLEKARQAALEGDMAKVAEEVLKNKAIMNAFDNNNVIQQEAAAKALGMGRKELADMVMEQQNLKMLQDQFGDGVTDMASAQAEYNRLKDAGLLTEEQIKALSEKGLDDQMASAAQAEKFAGVMAKIQSIFVSMAEPVLAVVEPLMDLVNLALNPIIAALTGISDLINAIFDPTKTLKETFQEMGPIVSFIAAGLTAAGLAITASMVPGLIKAGVAAAMALPSLISGAIAAVTSASALTLGIGAIAIAAGIAAVVASMSQAKSSMEDGIIGPGGEMVVSGPKGSIQLDKDDSIVAGTDLGGNKKPTSSQEKNTIPISSFSDKIVEAINTQNQLLEQLAGRKIIVEMDGNQVGQSLNVAERSLQ